MYGEGNEGGGGEEYGEYFPVSRDKDIICEIINFRINSNQTNELHELHRTYAGNCRPGRFNN